MPAHATCSPLTFPQGSIMFVVLLRSLIAQPNIAPPHWRSAMRAGPTPCGSALALRMIRAQARGFLHEHDSRQRRIHVSGRRSWAKLPDGWEFGDVAAVGVDGKDRVYVFNRGEHPMMRVRPRRQLPALVGRGHLQARARRPHGAGRHDLPAPTTATTRCASARSTARCCSTIGIPGKPAPFMSGEPFHRCTHTALSPERRHLRLRRLRQRARAQVRPDGKRLMSLGRAGRRARASSTCRTTSLRRRRLGLRRRPREPPRPGVRRQRQVRRRSGTTCTGRAGCYMPPGKCPICYIGEIGPYYGFNRGAPNLGPRVSDPGPQGQAAGAPRQRSAGRHRARPIHLAARPGGGFARRHLCRRSGRHRLAVAVSGQAGAKATAQPAEVHQGRMTRQPANFATACASAAGLTGFARNAFMPAASAASSSAIAVRPEMPITGTSAAAPLSARIARVAARPSMPGSVTSISTRS